MLEQSRMLGEIVELTKALLGFWKYRYSVICDNSPLGENCIYARQARTMAKTQDTALLKLISELHLLTGRYLSDVSHCEQNAHDQQIGGDSVSDLD